MTKHGSASPRKQKSRTLDADLKRRARKLATDSRVDPRTRSLIRYGLEIKDPYLEQVVNRVEAGEMDIDHIHLGMIKNSPRRSVSLRRITVETRRLRCPPPRSFIQRCSWSIRCAALKRQSDFIVSQPCRRHFLLEGFHRLQTSHQTMTMAPFFFLPCGSLFEICRCLRATKRTRRRH
jgi:hypothetical protein